MKQTILFLILITCINASEFPHIQPIAVEEAPKLKKTLIISHPAKTLSITSPLDMDKDGVLDDKDRCLNTPEGIVVDIYGCELDKDNDGVAYTADDCPNTSENFGVDKEGCPSNATLKVNFAPDMWNIRDDLTSDLKNFAKFLQENTQYEVTIYGYTDSIGTREMNQILSQKRANSVKQKLQHYGIENHRLVAVGKSESDPIATNMYMKGRAQNRRIEVILKK